MSKKNTIREIKQATKKRFTADQKIQIVLEGLRSEKTIAEICRREDIAKPTYYTWSKAFLDAGKNGLTLDTKRNATSDEVRLLKEENGDLRRAVSEQALGVIRLKNRWEFLPKKIKV